jgi:MFS transporter, ACS family, tartrate transporter
MTDIEKAVLRKNAWRFLPVLILAYIVNYLDRTSLSVAGLTMNHDLGLTASQFGYAAGIFSVGYCLLEVPSNLALYRVGPKIWLARIMITWGVVSAATAFVVGEKSFYLIRFLLGIAEAGFAPGVLFFLSSWFPASYRARILAWFVIGTPASFLIGTPIAGLLLKLHGMSGLAGWQWMFIIISLPAVVLGIVAYKILENTPEEAGWLNDEERLVLKNMMMTENHVRHESSFTAMLTDVRVAILAAIQFGLIVGIYGIGIWLPQMLKTAYLSNLQASFLTTIPYLFATFLPIAWAAYADKHDATINSVIGGALLAAIGLLISVASDSMPIRIFGITVALVGINSSRAIFWAIPPRFLSGAAAAGGLALINSIGTLGGFVGPVMMGLLTDATKSFTAGMMGIASFLLLSASLAGVLKSFFRPSNGTLAKGYPNPP